jgi:hypothetical protein
MSRTSLLDEPADIHAELGSATWSRGVARAILVQSKQLDSDVASLKRWIQIAKDHEAWKSLGYVSLEMFLAKESKVPVNKLEAIIGAKDGTKLRDAIKPLADVGPPTKEEKANVGSSNNDTVGNTNDYLLRRLARDAPEMLDKIEAGELSVNAAAIQAGIRKKPTPEEVCVKAFDKSQSRLVPLRAIVDRLQPYEIEVVKGWFANAEI